MTGFISKSFTWADVGTNRQDVWLNSLSDKEHGIIVVGYTAYERGLQITVKRWKRSDAPGAGAVRATIDEIPQEPSIDYETEEPVQPSGVFGTSV